MDIIPPVEAAGAKGRRVLDVRQPSEFVLGRVPGALHLGLEVGAEA